MDERDRVHLPSREFAMLMSLTFSARPRETPTGMCVDLAGCLDVAVCDQLAATLHRLLSRAPGMLELNLHGLHLMDAGGISTLIRAQRLARERGCGLFVSHPHGIVRKVMIITGTLDGLTHRPAPQQGPTDLLPST